MEKKFSFLNYENTEMCITSIKKKSHISKFNTYTNANITNVPSRFCYALCLALKGKLLLRDVAVIVVSCQHSHVYFFNDTKTSYNPAQSLHFRDGKHSTC